MSVSKVIEAFASRIACSIGGKISSPLSRTFFALS